MKETVNHPDHYGGKDNPYEAIKIIEAWDLDFHLGNAVKYIARCGKKTPDPLEDLKKAKWYIDRAIQLLEGEIIESKFPSGGIAVGDKDGEGANFEVPEPLGPITAQISSDFWGALGRHKRNSVK